MTALRSWSAPPPRPQARDLEWNRLIKEMPVCEYCDWVRAGRPGFADMAPHIIRAWQEDRARA